MWVKISPVRKQEKTMTNPHTDFWLKLLNYASERKTQRLRIWNGYLHWKVANQPDVHIGPDDSKPDTKIFERYREELSENQKKELEALAEGLGGDPPYFGYSSSGPYPYMDFSGCEFGDVSFEGLMLFNADFSKAVFKGRAAFRKAIFVDPVGFRDCAFERRADFTGATFTNTTDFSAASFRELAAFDSVTFRGHCSFQNTKFLPCTADQGEAYGGAGFRDTKFISDTRFNDAQFSVCALFTACEFQGSVDFSNTNFSKLANFEKANFRNKSEFNRSSFACSPNFNDATFGSTTSFAGVSFDRPPRFFETRLHEDTDFSSINWRRAEDSYAPTSPAGQRKSKSPDASAHQSVKLHDAIRAWDRLSLIASKLERFSERHEFYRLRMRAERWASGCSLLSAASWLFDVSSEYGWSVSRSLIWWFSHWVLMGLTLFVSAVQLACAPNELSLLFQSILASFANAHAFLGLGSEGGYLHHAREYFSNTEGLSGFARFVGVTQAFTGPILLFLVLLAVRNRFRLR